MEELDLLSKKNKRNRVIRDDKVYVNGLFPTFKRYYDLFFNLSDLSVLRVLEYEKLSEHIFSGKILDYGGGEKSRYRHLINKWAGNCIYESVNIDKEISPTYIIDKSVKLPMQDNQYKHVLSLNTLEHIYNVRLALKEIHRVLIEKGEVILSVPFIFRVHGHPDDYLRCTASWWSETLSQIGFDSIKIEALNWGPFTTASTISGLPGPFKFIRLHANLLTDVLYASLRYPNRKKYNETHDASICNTTLGYFIIARKK